jgi:hypothetical protein
VTLSSPYLNIAVLGDLHGQFLLAFTLLKRWEQETGKTLDLILQVGDAGIWPRPDIVLDDETRRFAQTDPHATSFTGYFDGSSPDAERFFVPGSSPSDTISAPFVFVRGNHEDHDFLEDIVRYRSPVNKTCYPVDFHQRIWLLPDGNVLTYSAKGQTIRIGGLGGLESGPPEVTFGRKHLNRLYAQDFDVLLTHEPFDNAIEGHSGSTNTGQLISSRQPVYHFCGHWHLSGRQLPANPTRSFLMEQLKFQSYKKLEKNSIGMLQWSKEHHSFSFLDEPWMKDYNRESV